MLLFTICIMMLLPNGNDAQIISSEVKSKISISAQSESLKRFYNLNENNLVWYSEGSDSKRKALLQFLDRAAEFGLPDAYTSGNLKSNSQFNSDEEKIEADQKLSDLAISFCRDLYCGREIDRWTSYDSISSQFRGKDLDRVVSALAAVHDSVDLVSFIEDLQPKTAEYNTLKQTLTQDTLTNFHRRQIETSLNYYRWIHHFQFDRFIVVNIPSATVKYYNANDVQLDMLAVVGKSTNKTPRFSAYCREVTLYPYWNVPRSILVNELFDKLERNPGYLDEQDMELIDKKGQVVSSSSIDWRNINESNFPYRVREKPGCSYALGVIKFSLDDPFDVYMHDTNFKGAFSSKKRFLSHGCIRVEKPVDLANAILPAPVDEGYLAACFKDEKPQVLPLDNPLPVFVVYMCAEGDGSGAVKYYDDVYGLLK
jgi:murein L,D-transpeptidase YcbB/YkuD